MAVKEGLKYSAEHEWIRIEGDFGYIGITDFAQAELGEIVYVEVETIGETLAQNDIFGTIEAVKTTSDLYMPISGEVVELNSKISEDGDDQPDLVNSDPYGEGWLVKVKITEPSELDGLMDHEKYSEHIS